MLHVSCDFPSVPCLRQPVLGDSASSTSPTCCVYYAKLAVQSLPLAQILIPVDCESWVYSELCSLGLPCPHCHLHPGLTRDPGLDILPPDLSFLAPCIPPSEVHLGEKFPVGVEDILTGKQHRLRALTWTLEPHEVRDLARSKGKAC